jgi:hypothetical protein
MAVRVKVKVTPEEYQLIKSSDYIDLKLEVVGNNVTDVIKLVTL